MTDNGATADFHDFVHVAGVEFHMLAPYLRPIVTSKLRIMIGLHPTSEDKTTFVLPNQSRQSFSNEDGTSPGFVEAFNPPHGPYPDS